MLLWRIVELAKEAEGDFSNRRLTDASLGISLR